MRHNMVGAPGNDRKIGGYAAENIVARRRIHLGTSGLLKIASHRSGKIGFFHLREHRRAGQS